MNLQAIAAIGQNGELGLDNDMPWKRSLKKDLAFFQKQTLNKTVVMGRKTYESIGKPLPSRKNVVITTQPLENEDIKTYPSFQAFLEDMKDEKDPVFVIGGESLYRQALEHCDRLILTEIKGNFQADRYFPDFDPDQYKKTVLEEVFENGLEYQHVVYKRISACEV